MGILENILSSVGNNRPSIEIGGETVFVLSSNLDDQKAAVRAALAFAATKIDDAEEKRKQPFNPDLDGPLGSMAEARKLELILGFPTIKNAYDQELCAVAAVLYPNFQAAMSLVDADGNQIAKTAEARIQLVEMFQRNPKIAAKIQNAIQDADDQAEEAVKNG